MPLFLNIFWMMFKHSLILFLCCCSFFDQSDPKKKGLFEKGKNKRPWVGLGIYIYIFSTKKTSQHNNSVESPYGGSPFHTFHLVPSGTFLQVVVEHQCRCHKRVQ